MVHGVKNGLVSMLTSDGGHNLGDQSVQVGVSWSFNTKFFGAEIINCLIVDHKCTIGVLQSCMSRQNGIIWFDDSCGDSWSWVNGEFQFGLLSIVNRKPFHEQGGEAGTSSSTE